VIFFYFVRQKMNDQLKSNRRVFMMQAMVAAGATALVSSVQAADMVSENDAQAKTLGYKADATKVDKAAQPKYAAGQHCGNCQLFQGKAADASGPCPLFGGKQVSAHGWCSAYAKKA
jgi:High potential iron-sulfur protein